ncbi:DUF192 domain-containing protein [Candidatus Woesearchaeota archaeon]|nr:DUF192 domain-containing protein [Candidatus Woesearchaeota archaeon]
MNIINLHHLGIKDVKRCNTHLSKSIGLMFSRRNNNKALVMEFNKEQKVPLHMFFVFYPIDILYINVGDDGNKKIIEIKENFMPFTFYFPKNKAKYVVELPANTVSKGKLNVNDTIML